MSNMATENDPLLPKQPATKNRMLYAAGGVLSVFLVAGVGYHFYGAYTNKLNTLSGWEERSAKWAGVQTCKSCAVVIPHPVLKGKGFGPAIDAHDCVVSPLSAFLPQPPSGPPSSPRNHSRDFGFRSFSSSPSFYPVLQTQISACCLLGFRRFGLTQLLNLRPRRCR